MEAYRDQYAELFRGGRDVVLIAVATDSPKTQYEWARDADFPFLFASDPGSSVGKMYGAFRSLPLGWVVDNRSLFIVDPQGVIRWVAAPFREIDPAAYQELGAAIDAIVAAGDE